METDLSRLIDALPGLVWTALPDGRADFFNQRWCAYTGMGVEAALGAGWLSAMHPDDRPHLLERWAAFLTAGTAGEVEGRLRRRDGVYRRFVFNASPITDPSGQIVRWCGVNTDIEDRRRAEEDLRAHERRSRLIIDGLPAIITLMTPDGELENGNRHMFDYFGKTLEELRALPFGHSFHPDDRAEVMRRWRRSVVTGEPYDHEARLRRADGAYRWFHTRGSALRDEDGRIVVWYLLQSDIEERKRAEALLAGEVRLLEMVARGSPLPEVLDALCRLVEEIAAGCLCSLLIVDPSGTTFQLGGGPSLPDSYNAVLDGKTIDPGYGPCSLAVALKAPVITADLARDPRWQGSVWPPLMGMHGLQSCWSMPIFSRQEKVLGVFAIYRREAVGPTEIELELIDRFTNIAGITIERAQADAALKQSEADLRRSEAHLSEAQRLSLTGSFTADLAADEHDWSRELYCIFEFDPATRVTLQAVRDVIHPEDVAAFEAEIARGGGRADADVRFRIVTARGAVKHLHAVAHRIDPARPVFVGGIQDVTERQLSEEALSKVRSELAHMARVTALGTLTASIAHEVNQPLSGIITNASTCLRMLAADPPNLDGARATAQRTIRDGNRAAEVITRLRALFGRQTVATDDVDLNEAAREVIALTVSELQRSHVLLRSEFAFDLPTVTGDRVQLQQVILNLLLNAVDAMSDVEGRPRKVVIRTERDDGDRVRLSVQDAGIGFDPQDAERLFDAFHTTKGSGMGIGLSISRSIVEAHGGRLTARRNEGPGATFVFSIPGRPEDLAPGDVGDAARPPTGPEPEPALGNA